MPVSHLIFSVWQCNILPILSLSLHSIHMSIINKMGSWQDRIYQGHICSILKWGLLWRVKVNSQHMCQHIKIHVLYCRKGVFQPGHNLQGLPIFLPNFAVFSGCSGSLLQSYLYKLNIIWQKYVYKRCKASLVHTKLMPDIHPSWNTVLWRF